MSDVDATPNTDAPTDATTTDVATDPLSPRQRTVYDMHQKGMRNVEIAVALDIAAGTVSNALVAAQTRLGERDSTSMGDIDPTQHANRCITRIDDEIAQHEAAITLLRTQRDGWVKVIDMLGDTTDAPKGDNA